MPFGIGSSGGFAPVAIGEAVSMLILAGVFIRRFPESVKGRWWIAPRLLARLWSAARDGQLHSTPPSQRRASAVHWDHQVSHTPFGSSLSVPAGSPAKAPVCSR